MPFVATSSVGIRLYPLLQCSAWAITAAQAPVPRGLDRDEPMRVGLFYESIRLPADEALGLLGKTLLFRARPHTLVGPFVLSAVSGRRGGFFVFGAEGRLGYEGRRLGYSAGLGVGGGGGVAAPVGDGLVWRPSVNITVPLSGWRMGATLSAVHFPSGAISSGQLGVSLERAELFRFTTPSRVGESIVVSERSGLGIDALSIGSSRMTFVTEVNLARTMTLVGVRATRTLGTPRALRWSGGIETYGAAGGDAAGYMEVLTVAGVEWPRAGRFSLGASGALGAGGGGAVPMGSGALARATVHATVELSPLLAVRAELGRQYALGSLLRGRSQTLAAGIPLAPQFGDTVRLLRIEWSPLLTHLVRGTRTGGQTASLQTLGLAIARYVSPRRYLVAQAHSAVGGAAGAYAVGLLGAGISSREYGRVMAGIAMLTGAAGGGGVATGGGAVVQWEGWAAIRMTEAVAARVVTGATRSVSGAFATPFVAIGGTSAMAMPGAR